MARELLGILGTASVASSCGISLILLLRKPLRTFFGPSLAYFLWLLVPTSILVPLLPAPSTGLKTVLPVPFSMPSLTGHVVVVSMSSGLAWVPWLIFAWASGALLFGLRLARQQRRFIGSLGLPIRDDGGVFHATFPTGSPVVVGFVRSKIVVPSDFATRYASEEQALILAHEQMHVRRGDLITNGMWALARCIFWFNPLVHIAARLSRFDQELACDAAVMRNHPNSRKPYATAMLRAQIADDALPLGCYWRSAHPLKERIMLLKQPPARGLRRAIGRILVGTCVCLIGYGTWAVEPDVAAGRQRRNKYLGFRGPHFFGQQGDRRASRGRGHRAILSGGIAPGTTDSSRSASAESSFVSRGRDHRAILSGGIAPGTTDSSRSPWAASTGSSLAMCDRPTARLLGYALRRGRLRPTRGRSQRHGSFPGTELCLRRSVSAAILGRAGFGTFRRRVRLRF
jgi:beta-lactamase regulating signal transducer with metallopeptidase domain